MDDGARIIIRSTVNGAGVANVLISLIATTDQAGVNSDEYLQAIQRNHQAVKENPKDWLPWNYLATLENIKMAKHSPEPHAVNSS